ncbi:hypothetical protein [Streptomyces sp. NPDC058463]|uniref:hypothetical protein n=1 Tax=Streptomyces sp. NPDC058463 TaxID=3346510 RepID=UPI0036638200
MGAATDGAAAWDARLGWAFGLTAEDPAERAAALDALADARGNVRAALGRYNELWSLNLPQAGKDPWQDPVFLRAYEAYREAGRHALPDALWNRPPGDIRTWPGLPYALLFLEWEARFPQEWTRHAKKWGTKQLLLRAVAVPGHGETVRTKLTDLVEIVVRRPYRCKDREYVRVARAIDSEDLRRRLETAARSDTPWARRHAGYVLRLLDHPEVPNTIHVWQKWLATEQLG